MTIAYWCVLFMGLFPYVAAGIAKKGFEGYDNGSEQLPTPCQEHANEGERHNSSNNRECTVKE